MMSESLSKIMTEMMDEFCDDLSLIEKYVFSGIYAYHDDNIIIHSFKKSVYNYRGYFTPFFQ